MSILQCSQILQARSSVQTRSNSDSHRERYR
jgi:hypothetical protein